MKAEIKGTISDDYSLFAKDIENRMVDTNSSHYKKVLRTLEIHGYLYEYPIVAYRKKSSSKLVIFDGQHRFEAAKMLGISFSYTIIDEPDYSVASIQVSGAWKPIDYINSYISQGKKDYGILKNYAERYNLSIMTIASILNGGCQRAQSVTQLFQSGDFKVKSTDIADELLGVLSEIKSLFPRCHDRKFLISMARCLHVDGFDSAKFLENVKKYPHLIKPCADMSQYMDMIEQAFNYRRRERLPLKYLADESAKARCGNKNSIKGE